jgi:hypothetical protein
MSSQDLQAMRINGKFNHDLVEAYCYKCGVLIAASPHASMLAFAESIHTCNRILSD